MSTSKFVLKMTIWRHWRGVTKARRGVEELKIAGSGQIPE